MTKKRRLHPGEVWWEALCDFRNELHEHVEEAKKDQLRFQTGRLFRSLIKRIKAEATGKDEWVAMFACYHFVTGISRHLGYDEAPRLHGEEMAASGLSSPGTFCSRPVSDLDELMFRVRSIASWMEAQESFSVWLIFKKLPLRGNRDERARALQACYLSQLPQKLLVKQKRRIGTNYDNKPWNDRQWKNILEHAVRLTKKRYDDCTELDEWLWWCYPVLKRYRWNTREVEEAALRRFNKPDSIPETKQLRRRMLTMGIPLSGKKQKQDRTPPLAQFVENVALPDPQKMWGTLGGLVTKINY